MSAFNIYKRLAIYFLNLLPPIQASVLGLIVFNPLLQSGRNSVRMAKISILKQEGIIETFPMSSASMSR